MKIKILIAVCLFWIFFFSCIYQKEKHQTVTATFVGSASCKNCHSSEWNAYTQSDHFHAMDTVSTEKVLGNFENTFFVYFGDTTFFYKRNHSFFVKTISASNAIQEFKIYYTLGWFPLQQYLIKFPDGRIQPLPFAWDCRPKEKGGQHWFHLFPNEKINPTDELFWMGMNQNWNFMCAECHTTDLHRNFDTTKNTYHTSWSENRVSCESCHGAASAHLDWANGGSGYDSLKGFRYSLSKNKNQFNGEIKNHTLTTSSINKDWLELETCGRCHSRSVRLTDDYVNGQPLLQSHQVDLMNGKNYFHDGQIREEDYEYGSFLQSKMFDKGVTCTNCHNPHSGKTYSIGNALCTSCHQAKYFDAPSHTFHSSETTGGSCTGCHMPERNYMVVDERLDHSIRIPRPDLSAQTAAPNACNSCHTNKSSEWAKQNFLKWYGDKIVSRPVQYGLLLSSIFNQSAGAGDSLNNLFRLNDLPQIINAAALTVTPQFLSASNFNSIKKYSASSFSLDRYAMAKAAAEFPEEQLLEVELPLLRDSLLGIRLIAFEALSSYFEKIPADFKSEFEKAKSEYINIQKGLMDRPDGYLNLVLTYTHLKLFSNAKYYYQKGIMNYPSDIGLYINYADLFRELNNDDSALIILQKALMVNSKNSMIHYSLGLLWIRKGESAKALEELKLAHDLNPTGKQEAYVYGVALFSKGQKEKGIKVMEDFIHKNGNDKNMIEALISYCNEMGNKGKENFYRNNYQLIYGN
ncbi:MAG: multiheme c-type cytochrome [Bacteroidota bacterium]